MEDEHSVSRSSNIHTTVFILQERSATSAWPALESMLSRGDAASRRRVASPHAESVQQCSMEAFSLERNTHAIGILWQICFSKDARPARWQTQNLNCAKMKLDPCRPFPPLDSPFSVRSTPTPDVLFQACESPRRDPQITNCFADIFLLHT